MTLALLLTAVTGAWAKTDPNAVYWTNEIWAGWAENVTTHTVGDITITCSGNAKAYESTTSNEPLAMEAGANDAITFTSNGKPFASIAIITDDELNVAGWTYNSSEWSYEWSGEPTTSVTLSGCDIKADEITFTFGTAEPPIGVTPVTGKTNEWTFAMPANDVVLTPIYSAATIYSGQTETPFETLKEAFANVKNGDIIKLDWNVTLTETLETPSTASDISFTLDFNGFVIDNTGGTNYIMIDNGCELTLTDNSTAQTGGLKSQYPIEGSNGGKFIFQGGRYNFSGCSSQVIALAWEGLVSNYGWVMGDGKEFVDLNNGQPDDDGFMVRVDWKTYELTIGPKRFATFYSDENIKFAEQPAEGVGLYTISSIDADRSTATVTPISGIIPAGTPMLVYNGTEQKQTAKLIVTLDNAQGAIDRAPQFMGTADDHEFTADDMAAAEPHAHDGGRSARDGDILVACRDTLAACDMVLLRNGWLAGALGRSGQVYAGRPTQYAVWEGRVPRGAERVHFQPRVLDCHITGVDAARGRSLQRKEGRTFQWHQAVWQG